MPATGQGLFFSRVTLAGVAVEFNFLTRLPSGAAQFIVVNHHASNNYTVGIGPVNVTLPAGVQLRFPITAATIAVNGTGDVSVIATDAQTPELNWNLSTTTALIADGSVTTVKLADGVLSADAAGRAKMAAGYFGLVAASRAHFATDFFDAATFLDKFATDSGTTAVLQKVIQDGAFSAADASRALFAANFLGTTATARALMQTGFFDLATLADKVAAGAIDNAFVQAKFAANAFGADAASRAAFVANFFDAATFRSKVAANAVDYSRLAINSETILADDNTALTAAQMVAGCMSITATAPRTKATDTAANIIAALPGQAVGTWFDMVISNDGASTLTLTAGAGVTARGSLVVAATGANTGYGRWRCLVTAAAAVTIFRN